MLHIAITAVKVFTSPGASVALGLQNSIALVRILLKVVPITSPDNAQLKQALRLHTSRGRKKQGRIVVFGTTEVQRALANGTPIEQLFLNRDHAGSATKHLKLDQETTVFELPSKLFEKLAFGNRLDGVVAVSRRPATELLDKDYGQFVIVVQSLEKPGNLGAVFRSCDGAGVDAVFVADPLTDVFHPNAIRASLGTVFGLPTAVTNSEAIAAHLSAHDYQILVARLDAQEDLFRADLTRRTAVVLGNEAEGVTSFWQRPEFTGVRLPMLGVADSLNISATTAVVAYEAMRQRVNTTVR